MRVRLLCFYELMRPKEIRKAIEGNVPLVWPIGVMEFHGGHLPVGTDTLSVIHTCERLEQEMDLMIFPPFRSWGLFPSTVLLYNVKVTRTVT